MACFLSGSTTAKLLVCLAMVALVLPAPSSWMAAAFQDQAPAALLKRADQFKQQGNTKDASELYVQVIEASEASSSQVEAAVRGADACFRNLGDQVAIDSLLSAAVEKHGEKPGVLAVAAERLLAAPSAGMVADGKFRRGYGRGYSGRGGFAGTSVYVDELDRSQAIRWLVKAIGLLPEDQGDASASTAELHLKLADAILRSREGHSAWLLQQLTDLDKPLDYNSLVERTRPPGRSPAVVEDGQPLLYAIPDSWAQAKSDGERLRWCIQVASLEPKTQTDAQLRWAGFLTTQFSVASLQQYSWAAQQRDPQDAQQKRFELHTLSEDEYLAQLSSGIERFSLPADYGPIRIYQAVAQKVESDRDNAATATWTLGQIHLNRRQYSQAAKWIETYIERFGDDSRKSKKAALDSIREPRLTLETIRPLLADQAGELKVLFRNTDKIEFSTSRVDIEKLLLDTKTYYRNYRANSGFDNPFGSVPGKRPPGLSSPQTIFNTEEIESYLSDDRQQWDVAVESRANHWDKRQSFEMPALSSGLYVIDALANGGKHRSRQLVWVQDIVLVRKPLEKQQLYILTHAATGQPVVGANVEFFGQRTVNGNGVRRERMETQNLAATTDAAGQVKIELAREFSWFAVARQKPDSITLLDFEGYFQFGRTLESFLNNRAYGVSDRPAYRPGDTVKIKLWVAQSGYGDQIADNWAGESIELLVQDPQSNELHKRTLTTDVYGGCDLEFVIPESAALGRYNCQVVSRSGNRQRRNIRCDLAFRVEEYRKPEFEVEVIAPSKPVALGQTVKPKIRATYYFGAPVAGAAATVTIQRSTYRDSYYPVTPYDWCYGPGFWWYASDYDWYPNWSLWRGCFMPPSPWWPRGGYEPTELVATQEVQLDENGEAELEIDTAQAKLLYGDEDHKYTIQVEVRDASRRTISAEGSVIAARQAFKIYAWTERGFYNAADRIDVNFDVRQLDGTAVGGAAQIDLLKIRYDGLGKPHETPVATQSVVVPEDGSFRQPFSAQSGGQYRVRLRMQDAFGQEVEGGYIFTVRGPGTTESDFRYTALELIPDKQFYAPGDIMRLQVASNFPAARVALMIRPTAGSYPMPQWIELDGKSTVVEIPITEADLPNFFVEALTVFDGQLHSAVRDVAVPPADKTLEVTLTSDKEEYLPGEEATVEVLVRDMNGNPVQGTCLITAYDRSLDQIAPDVLPEDIREAFWKWQRQHYVNQRSSSDNLGYPLSLVDVPRLNPLGIFGGSLADDLESGLPGAMQFGGGGYGAEMALGRGAASGFGGGGGMGGMGAGVQADMAPMAMKAAGMPQSGGDASEAPAARKDFADSAVWVAAITTDSTGKASQSFKMPENLTGWQICSWAVGSKVRVGSAKIQAMTRKPLLVRMLTPRFVIERDIATLSAIVHNDLPNTQKVSVRLEIDGETQLELLDPDTSEQVVTIDSMGQMRVNWSVRGLAAGETAVRAIAIGQDGQDAVQVDMPIAVYGLLKTDSYAGTVTSGSDSSKINIQVPQERRVEHSRLTVRMSPSLAASMVDALPYLIQYPYGCTEQTLNRFLPAVITRKTLSQMGVDLAKLEAAQNNLNAQEVGASLRQRTPTKLNPVYDAAELDKVVSMGVRRLTDMQLSDGGWGWFSGTEERSSVHTTATVMRGLLIAQEHGVAIVPDVLTRGLNWLEQHAASRVGLLSAEADPRQPDNSDALCLYVMCLNGQFNPELQSLVYDRRQQLSTYGLSLLALVAHRSSNAEQLQMLRRNIEQFLVQDEENETAFLNNPQPYWYWYGSPIETNAMYLKLLAAVDPKSPIAARVVKYLLNNRRNATYWHNTRDTALCVEAMGDFLAATGETQGSSTVDVLLGGKRLGRVEFTPENLFSVNNTLEISGRALPAGEHELEIRRTGGGNLYWNAYVTNFTRQEHITPAGLELKVERRYYLLEPAEAELTLPGVNSSIVVAEQEAFMRTPITDGMAIASGSLVEVELLIQSKNDYEYILLEDRKPACLEPVDTQSGYMYEAGLMIYRELREQHVGLCIQQLPQGNYSIRYQLRSETPGVFDAPAAVLQGMYATELIGNSSNLKMRVVDAE